MKSKQRKRCNQKVVLSEHMALKQLRLEANLTLKVAGEKLLPTSTDMLPGRIIFNEDLCGCTGGCSMLCKGTGTRVDLLLFDLDSLLCQ